MKLLANLRTLLDMYAHPWRTIDELTDIVWDYALPFLEDCNQDVFDMIDKIFTLVAILALYSGMQSQSWIYFVHLVGVLGIAKNILLLYRETLNEEDPGQLRQKGRRDTDNRTTTQRRASAFNFDQDDMIDNKDSVAFDFDQLEHFCVYNRKPTLDWLNSAVRTCWLNFRAYAKHKVLNEIWPQAEKHLLGTPLETLKIFDFNIGDKAIRVNSVDCIADQSVHEIIIDLDVAYDGNANVTFTYAQKGLNVFKPVTLQKFTMSNVKVRCVLKGVSGQLPFVQGIQLFFLEAPEIDWHAADAAKVIDMPGLDRVIKEAIENQIIQRFVLPNKFSMPVEISPETAIWLKSLGLPLIASAEECDIALPVPKGVTKVTVVRAEGLKAMDLGFRHYQTSENLNLCEPNRMSCSELLPKKDSSNTYVKVSMGKEVYVSETVFQKLNPEYNFTCEFIIEYHYKSLVTLEIFDQALCNKTGMPSDDMLGKVTEKIRIIKKMKEVEGWYNFQIYKGRIYLKFEWIPLELPLSDKVSGALSLLVGTVHSEENVRPTCYMDLMLAEEKLQSKFTLDALSNETSWTFNEGKVFRVENLKAAGLCLDIRIFDNLSDAFIAHRKFKMERLLENPLRGYYKVQPYDQTGQTGRGKRLALYLRSQIYHDAK